MRAAKLASTFVTASVVLVSLAFGPAPVMAAHVQDDLVLDCQPEDASASTGTVLSITCTVTNAGKPAVDVSVAGEVLKGSVSDVDGSAPPPEFFDTSDENGKLVFTHTSKTPGVDQICFWLDLDQKDNVNEGDPSCLETTHTDRLDVTWVEPSPSPSPSASPQPSASPSKSGSPSPSPSPSARPSPSAGTDEPPVPPPSDPLMSAEGLIRKPPPTTTWTSIRLDLKRLVAFGEVDATKDACESKRQVVLYGVTEKGAVVAGRDGSTKGGRWSIELAPGSRSRRPEPGPYSEYFARVNPVDRAGLTCAADRSVPVFRETTLGTGPYWTPLGPDAMVYSTPGCGDCPRRFSGRVSAIAPHPTDPQTIYVGTAGGGVWKTVDGGDSWDPLFDTQPSLAIGAIALDPANPRTIYVGTGEAIYYSGYYGMGLFRSTDAGGTWTKLGGTLFDGCHFADIVVKQGDSRTLLAAVDATMGTDAPGCAGGVYRSIDGGGAWTRVIANNEQDLATNPNAQASNWHDFGPSDLLADPGNPNVVYAAIGGRGIEKSENFGGSWDLLRGGFPTTDLGRIEMAISRGGTPTIYAAVVVPYVRVGVPALEPGELAGLWSSSDSGVSWRREPDVVAQGTGDRVCRTGTNSPQCAHDLTIAVDPANPSRLFIGGVLFFTSIDNAQHWRVQNIPHSDVQTTAFDASGRLLVGTDGGIYRTSDGGFTFANLNSNLATAQVTQGISGDLDRMLLAGMWDNGTSMFTGDRVWRQLIGGDGGPTIVDPRRFDTFYVTLNSALFKTTTRGAMFSVISGFGTMSGIPDSENRLFTLPFIADRGDPDTLYAGASRVWASTNAGGRWDPISSQAIATGRPWMLPECCTTALAQSASRLGRMYAGTGQGRVFVRDVVGGEWVERSSGLPGRPVMDLAVDSRNPDAAYAAVSRFGGGHVYRTTNGGVTWTDISGDLPNVPAVSVALDARATGVKVFVGTDDGMFWSTADGTWRRYGAGLPRAIVTDLLFDPATGNLIAATYGRGLFYIRVGL